MSDIYQLIAEFRRAGAIIELGGGDRVRFKPGQAPLPPGLLAELRARKAEVIARAAGALNDRQFAGKFSTELDFGQQMKLRMDGSFAVHLA